jgi:hypothetical protein
MSIFAGNGMTFFMMIVSTCQVSNAQLIFTLMSTNLDVIWSKDCDSNFGILFRRRAGGDVEDLTVLAPWYRRLVRDIRSKSICLSFEYIR